MKVKCIGGGPSGLYFAVLMKLRDPSHHVEVYERHDENDTFGWGVVLSDQVTDDVIREDPVLAERMMRHCAQWNSVELRLRDSSSVTSGHRYIGIGRNKLLNILGERAREVGVEVHYGVEVTSLDDFQDADLVIASDGINSKVRTQFAEHFEPDIDTRTNRYIWLGTQQPFPAFTFCFEETEHGWFQAHAYQFEAGTSTFIVECTESTYQAHGLEEASETESIKFCEQLFAKHLGGQSLMVNGKHLRGSRWLAFHRVSNARWHHGNVVLLGDSAHTAHFSIGSGTRLGFEDAVDLTHSLHEHEDLETALTEYEKARRVAVLRIQSAARNSTEWFENVSRYVHMPHKQFFYSMLTRSQRLSHENLKERDPEWLGSYEQWFAATAGISDDEPTPPPMFTPFSLREMSLANRVVLSPMSTYSAASGCPNAFHLVHLGARALGGAALLITEMTAVNPRGRITPGCVGLYDDAHECAWREVTDFVHQNSQAKIACQLGHSGPRGSTHPPLERANLPLTEGAWPTLGATTIQPWQGCPAPVELLPVDMDKIIEDYALATQRAHRAGFDMIELHAAHGYLLASFLSPLLNQREDNYGGHIQRRLRFPLRVFEAVRAVWPKAKPISVRISATDWVEGGQTLEDAVEVAAAFKAVGADIINVSSGQTTPEEEPVYGRMYQAPLSDMIRNDAGVPTMVAGNIYLPDHVNSIVAAGRADLCCIGRPHLTEANWTLKAALEQGVDLDWPRQYRAGFEQLKRLKKRNEDLAIRV